MRKTPGGKRKKVFERRRPGHASCGNCGNKLAGVPRERPSGISKLSATKKKPSRKFGGNLCSSCSRSSIKQQVLKQWA